VNDAVIALFDQERKQYINKTLTGPLEIASLTGNITRLEDGKPFAHLHAVLTDAEMNAFGGHLVRAAVNPTCELFLHPLPDAVERRFKPELGLKLMEL